MNRRELHREAHRLVDLGYRLVPIRYGGKTPLVRWKDLESGHRAVDRWMGRFGAMNLAVHTGRSGVVGLDADTDRAAEWIAGNCPETPMVCRTPRGGIHAYFRAPRIPRRRRSTCSASGSTCGRGGASSWSARRGAPSIVGAGSGGTASSAQASCRCCPTGRCGGSPGPRRLAARSPPGRAVRGFATSPGGSCASSRSRGRTGAGSASRSPAGSSTPGWIGTRAWAALLAWNERMAEPPWSERELRHKLDGALKRFR